MEYKLWERCVLFYADDSLLVARSSRWVQKIFNALVVIFEKVELHKNTEKKRKWCVSQETFRMSSLNILISGRWMEREEYSAPGNGAENFLHCAVISSQEALSQFT